MTESVETLKIRNWETFQHYRDRSPPWIKLHVEILSSKDWVLATDRTKLLMVVCMLVASRNGGEIPNEPEYLKKVGQLNHVPDLSPLMSGDNPWLQASASTIAQASAIPRALARGEKRRGEESREEKSREEESCTEPSEQNPLVLIPASKNGTFFPVDEAKRAEYELSYPGVDVLQELRSIRQWAIDNPTKRKTIRGMSRHINAWMSRSQNDHRQKRVPKTSAQRLAEIEKISRDMENDH